MADIEISLLFNFFLFLLTPFIFASVSQKLKLSPVVGYIIGGLILGNILPTASTNQAIANFAYFGIILLLFTVGLEINFGHLINLKRFIIIGGSFQLLLSIIFIAILSLIFNFSFIEAILIGIALSSSSTTLVAKIIQERGEEHSFIGEIALGILMFQDIAFIPYMIIFTSITAKSLSIIPLSLNITRSFIESTVIIAALWYTGWRIVPRIFDQVAKISRELLNLFVIVFIFFIAYLSLLLHIPILVGIFVAGVLVAQTLEHYHIFSQVRPLRDLLAVIFFVFIGTNVKLSLIVPFLPQIIFFTLAVVVVKAMIILFIFLFFRFHSKTAFSLALYLFQIDEDAFILMSAAYGNGVISQSTYLFIITSVLLSLIVTPILIKEKDKIYQAIRVFIKRFLPFLENFIKYRIDRDLSPIDVLPIKNHVIICGYGRVGNLIGRSLLLANIPYLAIDYNFHTVEKARKEGVNIIYGDPTDRDILDYAQIEEAKILILALPERHSQETIILTAKRLNPKIFIISRVHKEADGKRMRDLGVNLIISPEFEASLSIIKKIYLWSQLPKEEILNKIKRLKIEYGLL
ncbi:MAG: cation:proton antiporter [Microgenomates group bacterium]